MQARRRCARSFPCPSEANQSTNFSTACSVLPFRGCAKTQSALEHTPAKNVTERHLANSRSQAP
eukprot:3453990-Amphidinium_carterae.1